jgi:cytochrome c55X
VRKGFRRAGLASCALGALHAAAVAAEPAASRQEELLRLLHQDCGSCHGLRLTGGLGPALTRPALAGKSAESLRATILEGRPGTPMPPWRSFMSRDEATWLVERLITGVANDE